MTKTIHFHEDVICPVYRSYLDDYKRYNVFYGGASSGKSYFAAQRDVFRCISEQGHNYLILRKVDRTSKDSTFADVKKIITDWNLWPYFKKNETEQRLKCLITGNNMIFKGLDNPEKIKSITFETGPVTDIRMEEATEFTYDDFNQIKLRLRGEARVPKQITLTFNPISALHWAKKYFFDIPLPLDKCSILKTTYKDNPFLEQEDIEEIERIKQEDPTYWKVYGLGEWGVLGNLVFHNYVIEEFDFTVKELQNNCYGQDYGFNHANTLIPVGFYDGEIYIWNEVYLLKHTNPEFIHVVNNTPWFSKKNRITADSAEPDRITEWKKQGYRVYPAKKGKGSLKTGIDYLRSKRIHVHRTKAPNTARELQLFKYRENSDGTPIDEFVELFDDCIAGMRYATEWLWSKGFGRARASTVKKKKYEGSVLDKIIEAENRRHGKKA
jgi:phage terminase large subunit